MPRIPSISWFSYFSNYDRARPQTIKYINSWRILKWTKASVRSFFSIKNHSKIHHNLKNYPCHNVFKNLSQVQEFYCIRKWKNSFHMTLDIVDSTMLSTKQTCSSTFFHLELWIEDDIDVQTEFNSKLLYWKKSDFLLNCWIKFIQSGIWIATL